MPLPSLRRHGKSVSASALVARNQEAPVEAGWLAGHWPERAIRYLDTGRSPYRCSARSGYASAKHGCRSRSSEESRTQDMGQLLPSERTYLTSTLWVDRTPHPFLRGPKKRSHCWPESPNSRDEGGGMTQHFCMPIAGIGLAPVRACLTAKAGHVWRERAANAYLVPKPERSVTRRTATESEMRHTAAYRRMPSPDRDVDVCSRDDPSQHRLAAGATGAGGSLDRPSESARRSRPPDPRLTRTALFVGARSGCGCHQ